MRSFTFTELSYAFVWAAAIGWAVHEATGNTHYAFWGGLGTAWAALVMQALGRAAAELGSIRVLLASLESQHGRSASTGS
jgi:hypothetical protein